MDEGVRDHVGMHRGRESATGGGVGESVKRIHRSVHHSAPRSAMLRHSNGRTRLSMTTYAGVALILMARTARVQSGRVASQPAVVLRSGHVSPFLQLLVRVRSGMAATVG